MSANDVQIGGVHYKSDLQHWDYVVEALHNRYLEGQVTKYIARHRKKNGREDVEKALHYCNKLIEEYAAGRVKCLFDGTVSHMAERFADANGLVGPERVVCVRIAKWVDMMDLRAIQQALARILATYTPPTDAAA